MDLVTGDPFWLRRSGLIRSYPVLRRDVMADVAVIGAGISGAFAAYELARAGAHVVIVDRHDVVSGSSAATTGLLLYDTDTSLEQLAEHIGGDAAARVYQLGLDAIDDIEQLTRSIGDSCGFARRPSLYLASRRRHVAELAREFDERRARGFDVTWMTSQAIGARYSFSARAGIHVTGTAEVDCYRLTHGLLAAAASHGAHVFDRTSVKPPVRGPHGLTLQTDAGFTITAAHVVWATGYETERMLKRRTGHLASTWVFVSEPLPHFDGWPDRCLIWETARPYLYVRSTDDGRLMAGGEDEPCAECHRSAWWFRTKTRRLHARVQGMFPSIPIDLAYAWAGTFATTDDGLPFIGSVEEWPGVSFALGYGGNGITFSAIAAKVIRDAVLGRPNPDAALFGFDRGKSRA